jgi:hypothetical protein
MGFPPEMAFHLSRPHPVAAGPADNDRGLGKLDENLLFHF